MATFAVKVKRLSGRFSPAYICAGLDKTAIGLASAENLARDNLELAIRGSNLVSGYPAAALGKTAIGPRVDKTAIGPAFAKNSLARPLIN